MPAQNQLTIEFWQLLFETSEPIRNCSWEHFNFTQWKSFKSLSNSICRSVYISCLPFWFLIRQSKFNIFKMRTVMNIGNSMYPWSPHSQMYRESEWQRGEQGRQKEINFACHTGTHGVIWLPLNWTFSSVPPIDSTRGFNVSSRRSVSSIVSKLNFT